jgi:Ca2+-binding RTX toxin-like protein
MRHLAQLRRFAIAVGASALVTVGLTALPASALVRPMCFGLPATIVGTNSPEVINGTPGPDVIVGMGGDDYIHGYGGNDRICDDSFDNYTGDYLDQTIYGGDGNDRIRGGVFLIGGHGDDLLIADESNGPPSEAGLSGGPGRDRLIGGPESDNLFAGDQDDTLSDSFSGDCTNLGECDYFGGQNGIDVCSGVLPEDAVDGCETINPGYAGSSPMR